jgi:hypothetical protein
VANRYPRKNKYGHIKSVNRYGCITTSNYQKPTEKQKHTLAIIGFNLSELKNDIEKILEGDDKKYVFGGRIEKNWEGERVVDGKFFIKKGNEIFYQSCREEKVVMQNNHHEKNNEEKKTYIDDAIAVLNFVSKYLATK